VAFPNPQSAITPKNKQTDNRCETLMLKAGNVYLLTSDTQAISDIQDFPDHLRRWLIAVRKFKKPSPSDKKTTMQQAKNINLFGIATHLFSRLGKCSASLSKSGSRIRK
jgi:hypothetical protein